jgi:hypothetical protein
LPICQARNTPLPSDPSAGEQKELKRERQRQQTKARLPPPPENKEEETLSSSESDPQRGCSFACAWVAEVRLALGQIHLLTGIMRVRADSDGVTEVVHHDGADQQYGIRLITLVKMNERMTIMSIPWRHTVLTAPVPVLLSGLPPRQVVMGAADVGRRRPDAGRVVTTPRVGPGRASACRVVRWSGFETVGRGLKQFHILRLSHSP